MAATNINRVVMTGNLTRDPELRSLPSGMSVCSLRIACNTRRKGASGEWEDKPNYFDVTVWGAQGENCARYLAKGRPVAIDGRLEWREYETETGRSARQSISSPIPCSSSAGVTTPAPGTGSPGLPHSVAGGGDVPIDDRDFQSAPAAPASTADDDIPF